MWIFLHYILVLQTLNPITRLIYYTPSFLRKELEGRNINRLSIGFPYTDVRLSLGTPNPPMIDIAEETLGFRRYEFSS